MQKKTLYITLLILAVGLAYSFRSGTERRAESTSSVPSTSESQREMHASENQTATDNPVPETGDTVQTAVTVSTGVAPLDTQTQQQLLTEEDVKAPQSNSSLALPSSTKGTASVENLSSRGKDRVDLKNTRTEAPFLLPPGQAPLQSPARPMDLEIIAEVQASVEDPGYVNFVNEVLPDLNLFLDEELVDWQSQENKAPNIELEDFKLLEDSEVRFYFVKEGTAWQNSLGIIIDGEEKLIFPNTSSAASYHKDAHTRMDMTTETVPLLPGDYVDLGVMTKGTLLDLFLIQDGARRDNGPVFGIDKESNPDHVNHVKIHEVLDDQTLVIGFEDLQADHPMADLDYNDVVIAVKMIPTASTLSAE